jgi:transcription-repair coupling factor (superfamily II helicase)
MADPKPMNRVVCGDVGVGKTEVAMRASFIAVNAGKQVALLVPTTLLAQLHQQRGRVGRSHHRAYAYLITPPPKAMAEDAKKRLEAIESLEDLGAGFTLATHDLEIRGAGELLGEEQSGQIHEIGCTL